MISNSNHKSIIEFLRRKSTKIQKLNYKPIIMKWLESPSMEKPLQIIDKKVEHLLENYQDGGEHKLIDWFLTGDINFVTQTAERYIVDYLISKNNNIFENLAKEGVDATLKAKDKNIGIEVTTMNGFIAEWILIERLSELLYSKYFLDDKTIRLSYDHERIMREFVDNRIHEYIKELGSAIEFGDTLNLKNLDVKIEIESRWSGVISWNHSKADSFKWYRYLTDELLAKLTVSNKKKQLMKYSKNIVFIGVNHIFPSNWAIPSIFEEIGIGGTFYSLQINGIEEFWTKAMQEHQNISGICFYYYSLDKVDPFYPVRIIWGKEKENLRLNT